MVIPNSLSRLQEIAPIDVAIENGRYNPSSEEDNYSFITHQEIRVGWGDVNVLLNTDLQDKIYSQGFETCSAVCGITEAGDFILAHDTTHRIKYLSPDNLQEAIAQNRAGKIDLGRIVSL